MAGTQPNQDTLLWGRVQKYLPLAQRMPEQVPTVARMGSYGELVMDRLCGKQYKTAEEGSYFVTRTPTPGTGVQGQTAVTSFVDTTPYLILSNNNPSGGRNIFPDYIKLTTTVAGGSGTNLLYATRIDSTLRYSSGTNVAGSAGTGLGTVLLGPYSMNSAGPNNSAALVYVGNITASAGSQNVRTVSNGSFRTAITVVNDQYYICFSGVDQELDTALVSGTAIAQRSVVHPPVMIGPGGSFLLYIYAASQAAPCYFEVEIGHIER